MLLIATFGNMQHVSTNTTEVLRIKFRVCNFLFYFSHWLIISDIMSYFLDKQIYE